VERLRPARRPGLRLRLNCLRRRATPRRSTLGLKDCDAEAVARGR
jgi:hypothetical protein